MKKLPAGHDEQLPAPGAALPPVALPMSEYVPLGHTVHVEEMPGLAPPLVENDPAGHAMQAVAWPCTA
jgi:hypothetical protein